MAGYVWLTNAVPPRALSLELTAAELARLEEVSRIELGFPHDFSADRLAYGDARPLIDSHRPHGPSPGATG